MTIRRFTPTHVGTTLAAPARFAVGAVHPHTRGDNGSSRGSPHSQRRFTPTHVGTTFCRLFASIDRAWFTPTHVGTTCLALSPDPLLSGSPPHTWGQRTATAGAGWRTRFTPTHVGTTEDLLLARSHRRGSPPHTWGQQTPSPRRLAGSRFTPTHVGTTHQPGREPLRNVRFTPTHVGTTDDASRQPRPCSVHPHTRGDNDEPAVSIGIGVRFTPTHVGTTWGPRRTAASPAPVHPHTRGDNAGQPRPPQGPCPVHPHTRGDNACPRVCRTIPLWFTPTHVGTTLESHATSHPQCGSPPHTWGQRQRLAVDRQR